METTEKTSDVLNDLIEINNDRVAGFEKALADIKDENIDLKEIFQRYAEQSRRFAEELSALVGANGSEVESGNSMSGTLHRAWIDVKSLFGSNDRASILEEAERGEDAIKNAYRSAISQADLSPAARETINSQSTEIISAHDQVRALRNTAKM